LFYLPVNNISLYSADCKPAKIKNQFYLPVNNIDILENGFRCSRIRLVSNRIQPSEYGNQSEPAPAGLCGKTFPDRLHIEFRGAFCIKIQSVLFLLDVPFFPIW